jgi:hypothetical protein
MPSRKVDQRPVGTNPALVGWIPPPTLRSPSLGSIARSVDRGCCAERVPGGIRCEIVVAFARVTNRHEHVLTPAPIGGRRDKDRDILAADVLMRLEEEDTRIHLQG